MAHVGHEELNKRIAAANKLVTIGAIYKHYKYPDRDYFVEKIVIQEATLKVAVLYRDVASSIAPSFVRDLDSWLEIVEWQGQVVPRFKKSILKE